MIEINESESITIQDDEEVKSEGSIPSDDGNIIEKDAPTPKLSIRP